MAPHFFDHHDSPSNLAKSQYLPGDWDLFLGPLEWAKAETGRADQREIWWRGFSGVARVNDFSFASSGYPILVFNQNSTLERAPEL